MILKIQLILQISINTFMSYFPRIESGIKTADSVSAPLTCTCFSMYPFFSSGPMSNFNFHKLVHYPSLYANIVVA